MKRIPPSVKLEEEFFEAIGSGGQLLPTAVMRGAQLTLQKGLEWEVRVSRACGCRACVCRRSEKLTALIPRLYVKGLSTRDVEAALAAELVRQIRSLRSGAGDQQTAKETA